MKLGVYVIRDVVSGQCLGTGLSPTDGAFMRDNMVYLLSRRRLEDLEYYHIGSFDEDNFTLESSPKRLCSNEAYKFPETKAQKLSEEDIEKLYQKIQENKSKKE